MSNSFKGYCQRVTTAAEAMLEAKSSNLRALACGMMASAVRK
jgi:hypothetical protein